jgi:putative ABC transport system substrate-binding protein
MKIRHAVIGKSKKTSVFGLALFAMLFALCFSAEAQQPKKVPRIGIISPGAPRDSSSRGPNLLGAFLEGLRDLGYVDGKNIQIEFRYAHGKPDRLPEIAAELVQLKVDAIYTGATPAILALKRLTNSIPIIIVSTTDPIRSGIVASLAQPGGNITGVSLMASDLWPKRLELLKEITPKLSRVAIFWNKSNAGMGIEAKATFEAAKPLGVTLQDRGVKSPDEIDSVLAEINKDRPDGFLALLDISLRTYQQQIFDFLLKHRLPAIFERKELVESGGLISYGPSYEEVYRRAAVHMDKVLKGIKPSNIPVEQPTKFEMVINLRTAKQIGLTIPPNVLARADRVIR